MAHECTADGCYLQQRLQLHLEQVADGSVKGGPQQLQAVVEEPAGADLAALTCRCAAGSNIVWQVQKMHEYRFSALIRDKLMKYGPQITATPRALVLAEFDPCWNVAQHQAQACVVELRDAFHRSGELRTLARL